jgi:uncharacterized protein (DUF1810 family)
MADTSDAPAPGDPFDLARFLTAQEGVYERALAEIASGHKRSHWMWFIFPQFDGLAFSETSKHFAIESRAEAAAYLAHPVLGARLIACAEAALTVDGRPVSAIFGSPDDLKLHSSATLFACVAPPGSAFERLLAKYYRGQRDQKTLRLLGESTGTDAPR